MATAQAFSKKEAAIFDSKLSNGRKFSRDDKLPNGSLSSNGQKSTSSHVTSKQQHNPRLEEQFKAACDAIQNLPKNGNNILRLLRG
jgi:hypothetical protein